jgi:aminoglycoside/choline kinase family phosphotransferase
MPAMTKATSIRKPEPDTRLAEARAWLAALSGQAAGDWSPIAGDASFRRYFRVGCDGSSQILMDAPPELEDSAPFVDIAARLRAAGLHAPEIFEADLERGFLLLEDLGNDLFRDLLNESTVDGLFCETFDALAVMARQVSCAGLPDFDPDTLRGELDWFTRYYLERERELSWDAHQIDVWEDFCSGLVDAAGAQPQVFVHRDVHSCNLLKVAENSPGIIDFQDAVRGPITYDFVSLVWDRYFTWPRERVENWMEQFRQRAAPDIAPHTWQRWCDRVGLQRNIKIVGRFALLKHQQGKDGYVQLIPRFYRHVLDVLSLYPEFEDIARQLGDPACAP